VALPECVPLFAVNVKPRVTAASPTFSVGAVKLALRFVAFDSVTAGPEVCDQRYVSGSAGLFGSLAVPVSVTAAVDATVCARPADAVGVPISALRATELDALPLCVPLFAVNVNPSVTGGSPAFSVGAVKPAPRLVAFDSVTAGPEVCDQR